MVADLFTAVAQTPGWQALSAKVAEGGVLSCCSIARQAQPFAVALLHRCFQSRVIVVVTENPVAQDRFHQDLCTWLELAQQGTYPARTSGGNPDIVAPGALCLYHPEWETQQHRERLPQADTLGDRLKTLISLKTHQAGQAPAPLVVTTATAFLERTFAPQEIARRCRALQRGDSLDPLDLIEWLEEQAYEPEAQVTQKGELAMRGGIVDVFPLTSDLPVRLEFFGNTLESIRFFDPVTQMSREQVPKVWLSPGGELGILRRLVCSRESPVGTTCVESANAPPVAVETCHPTESAPRSVPTGLGTIVDYLPGGSVIVLCEPPNLSVAPAASPREVSHEDVLLADWEELLNQARSAGVACVGLSETGMPEHPGVDLAIQSIEVFRPVSEHLPDLLIVEKQRREFFSQIHRWVRQGEAVHVFLSNENERTRFSELWKEYGFASEGFCASGVNAPDAGGSAQESGLRVHVASLSGGFVGSEARIVVVTDGEVFGRYRVRRPRQLRTARPAAAGPAVTISAADLEEGDYVVHVQYGVGRFVRLERLSSGPSADRGCDAGGGEECIVIEYAPRHEGAPRPRLHVPVSQAHLVTKYIGAGKSSPPLNTLGGTRWRKTKAAAVEAARDLAADLLAVQASREAIPRCAFPPDGPWQREFESAFAYEETPDQLRAIDDTKHDMSLPRPMDRLVCGDAGFGKTEVALRAAFKAVLAGKQVAVLVPTTVLAQQHFNTFAERMAGYPVRIEVLSRFRSRAQQQRVIRDLALGGVDIVIGTHRLLQSDVVFKDLGLVVIDEEQRFGVVHKEQLKRLRQLVDVLTLTATPIPRTLYLALAGARDMSSIETPPHDRLPVETIVAPYDERLVRDAIMRELHRGGQVFYLHNRIFDIDSVALKLRSLVPEARIAVGHGQMRDGELERTMTRFVNGECDLLLSTTIVESGIDIPNANTIIIDRADRFGLSDLYQLRGRVGRYKHQAYAYLLIPRHAGLLSDARKRIAAIKQFTKPGSGFKIAMRDLEIRGAGNLLGPEQSGHITAIGFELYCQLLKQSIGALKGEQAQPRIEVNLDIDFLDSAPVTASAPRPATSRKRARPDRIPPDLGIEVPREVAVWTPDIETVAEPPEQDSASPLRRAAAALPLDYVSEPRHRLEFYRKLAQATDQSEIDALRNEMRDRFGRLPQACELLLLAASLKPLAARAGISSVETRGNRLMLMRGGDYVTIDGRFPRLCRRSPKARLNEIRKFLDSLARKQPPSHEPITPAPEPPRGSLAG